MKNVFLYLSMALGLSGCGCETVDTGNRGIKTTFGEIQGEPLPEGFYTYNPFTSGIHEISVQEVKKEGDAACYTKDTQQVVVKFAVTYFPDPARIGDIYKQFGAGWDEKVVVPAILGSIKDVVGKYIADDLVGKREQVRSEATAEIVRTLGARHITATRLDLINLDFDDAYEKAVEAKVVAVQRSAEAKNQTVQYEEQAKQKVISAKADAEAMTIKSEALAKNKGLVEFEAVQKWNGVLPVTMMGSSTPFINLSREKL